MRGSSSSASVKRSTQKTAVKAKPPTKKKNARSKNAEPDLANDGLALVEAVGSGNEEGVDAKSVHADEPDPEEDPEAQLGEHHIAPVWH